MARDKRGQVPEPTIDEAFEEIATPDTAEDFIAGPTSRNEAGDMKRAAAKAIGTMGASKKIDPDLAVDPDGNRAKSGSGAAIRSFKDTPPGKGAEEVKITLSNREIADSVPTTAQKSPASPLPPEPTETPSAIVNRRRVPAPGNIVGAPKSTFIRNGQSKIESDKRASKRSR